MEYKTCKRCGRKKPLDKFYWSGGKYKRNICDVCHCKQANASKSQQRRKKGLLTKTCVVCGLDFTTYQPHRLYCSKPCKLSVNRIQMSFANSPYVIAPETELELHTPEYQIPPGAKEHYGLVSPAM